MENKELNNIKKEINIKELLEFGIINIDKPSGPTSFSISDFVRKTLKDFGIRKTSHFGTLDPKVTGVLPIALNRACKLTGYFLGEDKEYMGIMRIHEDISIEQIQKVIEEKFTGKITQKPPVRSRVKREEREREVKKFKILEKQEKDILFSVECQGGTYVRKLIDDLGKELGIGAHMLELRRTRAGIFKEEEAITLYQLEEAIKKNNLDKIIIPAEEAIRRVFPAVEIKRDALDRILHGQPIYYKNLEKIKEIDTDRFICVFSKEQFVGIFKVVNNQETFAKSEFVMQPLT